MTSRLQNLPVAWLQLTHSRSKLMAAVIGIVFADLLMWMQLGFRAAAIDSSLYIHGRLLGELVIVNPQTEQIDTAKSFPRRQLARVQAHPDVESAAPLYTGLVQWRDPWSGLKKNLFVFGIVPHAPAIDVPGVAEFAGSLHDADTCLFDTKSRKEFRNVVERVSGGESVVAEANSRQIKVVGTTTIGASFQVDGNLVTSDTNFIRLFPQRTLASVDLGVVRLRPGANPIQVRRELNQVFGSDLLILSNAEYKEREKQFFLSTRPINFVFSVGTAVGFLVGFAIVYQVLFSEISNHLPQFATLKAIGYQDGELRRIVLNESLILSMLGYFPGAALAGVVYFLTATATSLPMRLTSTRALLIFVLTIAMCSFSGLVAMQKLKQADPADVF